MVHQGSRDRGGESQREEEGEYRSFRSFFPSHHMCDVCVHSSESNEEGEGVGGWRDSNERASACTSGTQPTLLSPLMLPQ